MRTSSSSYGSLHRRPMSALARSHALDSEPIDDYQLPLTKSRARGNHGPRLTHSRAGLTVGRTTSLDESHIPEDLSQDYYFPVRPNSRARTGFSASRTGSVDGTGINRLNYMYPTSLALEPMETYHQGQQFQGSIDDTAVQLNYYQTNSMMAHPAKIQRQRSLNTEYPDEYDYSNMYVDSTIQDPLSYSNQDYQMDPVASRLEIAYNTGSMQRRQPESILKNGHGTDGNGQRLGLNPDLMPEGSVAGSSYRSSSDGFDRGSYYPAKKSSVCSSRGYSKSSEDSYNNENSALLNRIENGESTTSTIVANGKVNGNGNNHNVTSNGNGNGTGVLRPLRPQSSIPNSGSYGRLHASNGTAMLGMGNTRTDEFEVYNKLSFNNPSNSRPSSVANGNTSARRKKEEEGDYPTLARAPSSGSQIVAKPIRPCCGGCCGGSTTSAINEGNPHQHAVPICLLFIIFLVVSVIVISGIMFYLKSGRTILLCKFLFVKRVHPTD